MQTWRFREKVMDVLEKTCGSRVIISTCTIGGTRRDISDEHLSEILSTLQDVQGHLDQVAHVIEKDYTIRKRCIGVGVLSKEQALAFGAVGPTLRGSGVAQDLRMTGYAAYGDLNFEPVVETGCDSYARAMVRVRECYQSIELVRKAIDRMPAGEIAVKVRGNPNGEAVMRVEQPRGEVFYYIKANGTKNLERLRVRTPTYQNAATLVAMLPGMTLADVPVIALSIDPCFSCTER
jgi:NADH-quinone oxidoreductase subunit D